MLRAQKFFQLLLLAYPVEFRREYGPHMTQLFRDCYQAEEGQPGRFWLSTMADLIRAAPREHLGRLGKENSIMKNLGRDALALIGAPGNNRHRVPTSELRQKAWRTFNYHFWLRPGRSGYGRHSRQHYCFSASQDYETQPSTNGVVELPDNLCRTSATARVNRRPQ
jgi:hypothetical protein